MIGQGPPSAHNPINVIGVMMGGIGAFWGVLSGLSLATARSCAQGEYVDVNNARLVRRLLGVWWGGTIFCAMAAGFAEVMSLRDEVSFTVGRGRVLHRAPRVSRQLLTPSFTSSALDTALIDWRAVVQEPVGFVVRTATA